MQRARVINRTRETTVGERVEIADTSLSRMWGLLGRTRLNAGEGLWIKPSSGVHTLGMKFPIDVLGLDRRMRVVKLWSDLTPYRVTGISFAITSVIELASGAAQQCLTQVGDQLEVELL